MADLTITAGSVVRVAGATEQGTAGGTVTAGMSVYQKASDSKWYGAIHTASATSGYGVRVGIALNGCSANQPITVQLSGTVTIGATVTVGVPYFVGDDAAGGICPLADIGSTDFTTYLGTATTAAIIDLKPHASGAQTA